MELSPHVRITYQMKDLKRLSVQDMMETGIAEKDAIFIFSLHEELKENLEIRMNNLEVELQKGLDDKLHVTTIHPIDEKQAGDLLETIRYRDREDIDFPEVRAMRIQGEAGETYIIDEAATQVLKEHMPYRFALSSFVTADEAAGMSMTGEVGENTIAEQSKNDHIPTMREEDWQLLKLMNQAIPSGPGRMLVEFTMRPPKGEDSEYSLEAIKIYKPARELPRGGVQDIVKYMELSPQYEMQGGQMAAYYEIAGTEIADLQRDLPYIIDASRNRGIV